MRSIATMEEVAGVGRAMMYRWFHLWGWPLRRPMLSRRGGRRNAPAFPVSAAPLASATSSPQAVPTGPRADPVGWRTTTRASLKERLKRLVEHRIALLEHEAMSGVAVDPDANARAIELNARTLVTIERLGEGEAASCPRCDDGRPQRSLNQLRDELRGHLQRIRREERAACGLPPEEDEEEDGSEAGVRVPLSPEVNRGA